MTRQPASISGTASAAGARHRPSHGLVVTLEARNGQQELLAQTLHEAFTTAIREAGTVTWYAYRITETRFGIFDTFFDEGARQTHRDGEVGRLLGRLGEEILVSPPDFKAISILAAKI
ncbi:putative quinol monooxygenase [Methylobacterium sp. J-076]|uniref:putative quinol monooxygenase n=1 Tax=Methylobacterium sp. J-076 TaxID=2836655 RepID=UPI001FB8B346|nr:antibiotic biosynthesis monooxygenase [Methylobacterium sp. J-076]MCJ2013591.1 antibiotic biosynthesis monooxygenase [Methylobacterium sp. J-076]